jgi:hypothetical protein
LEKYPYVVTARLTEEGKREYERLLKRFGKSLWSSKSENFRELIRRLSSELCMETRWDNPGFDSLDEEESTEQPHGEE